MEFNKDNLVAALSEFLEKNFGATKQEATEEQSTIPIAKSVDTEKRLFTAVVLRPNVVDAHGDIYDEDVVEKACHEYNEVCRKANLQHLIDIDKAVPVESYIAPADFQLGEGDVFKGDWVMTMRVDDEDIWKACKDGLFTGFSVGCKGEVEDLDD